MTENPNGTIVVETTGKPYDVFVVTSNGGHSSKKSNTINYTIRDTPIELYVGMRLALELGGKPEGTWEISNNATPQENLPGGPFSYTIKPLQEKIH